MLHDLVPGHPVIRTMPNTPLSVGMGMTALTADDQVAPEVLDEAEAIFQSCGETVRVDEKAMEAITAISGCGPGYFFVVMDALADAGVMAGLPRAWPSNWRPRPWRAAVSWAEDRSPSGPAPGSGNQPGRHHHCRIKALENHGVRGAFYDAVQAVLDRSAALKK